ncbi:hypothetical protein J4Q44_G00105140 [Coregonus suidteri]|uniref:Uncharacterized protein n=1 Tax=Coregonus suidteri TaxID=861788 RepID=A0AAN8LV88_9TELE
MRRSLMNIGTFIIPFHYTQKNLSFTYPKWPMSPKILDSSMESYIQVDLWSRRMRVSCGGV